MLHHVSIGVSYYLHGPRAAAPLYWCWGFGAKFCEFEMELLQGSETGLKQGPMPDPGIISLSLSLPILFILRFV